MGDELHVFGHESSDSAFRYGTNHEFTLAGDGTIQRCDGQKIDQKQLSLVLDECDSIRAKSDTTVLVPKIGSTELEEHPLAEVSHTAGTFVLNYFLDWHDRDSSFVTAPERDPSAFEVLEKEVMGHMPPTPSPIYLRVADNRYYPLPR